ncbi:MAG: type II toxin-antitoxin system VapC family toxin [bacterium]|jgi:predicted nucleic acid-binding protein|nr:type II toxin-antitoxin system VapC family toxin [Betaproteobacteria bacterium]
MIVVDTNVLAYLFLPGPRSGNAEALLLQHPEWAAPVLWRSEFRNVLAGFMRRGALSLEQARSTIEEAEGLMAGAEFDVDSRDVLELVDRSRCSAHDCEFVALANRLQTRLFTADAALLAAFPASVSPLPSA